VRISESGSSVVLRALAILSLLAPAMACDQGTQDIYVAAQDFRFVPNEIHLVGNRLSRLIVRNEGRERHQFISPLLDRADVRLPTPNTLPNATAPDGIAILPGQSLALQFIPEPGTYEIRCLIKGHAGMRGMIIVEG